VGIYFLKKIFKQQINTFICCLNKIKNTHNLPHKYMIEPLLFGIVLGIVPVTIVGLFVAAYLQYRRGNQLGL